MRTRWSWIPIFVIGLFTGLFLFGQPARAFPANCTRTYLVKPGDNLFRISLQEGKSTYELAALNNIVNIHLIYAGTVLCVDTAVSESPSVALTQSSSLVILASYQTKPNDTTDGANQWTLGQNGRFGLSKTYPLLTGDHIETYSNYEHVEEASFQRGDPILWLVTNEDENETAYTLVAIGDSQPIEELLPNNTNINVTPGKSLAELAEANSNIQSVEMSALLMGRDGMFIPVTVTRMDYQTDLTVALRLYSADGIAFALHPGATPNSYELLMVLNDDGTIGPPGPGWSQHCNNWQTGGWWNRFRYSWYGCS